VKNPDWAPPAASHADVGARLMLVILCFIWGVTWPLMKIALYEIPPFSMRTVTAALGALTLYGFCRTTGRSLYLPNVKAAVHVVIASLLNVVAFSIFGSFAQLSASTSRVTILAYTIPIWAVLFAWLFLGERPNRMQGLALALCAAGLAVLIYPLAETHIPPGIVLALLTGISWGVGTIYVKWAQIDADPMGVTCWQVIIAFVVLLNCLMIVDGVPHLAGASLLALACTVSTGILANGVAYGLWFTIIRRLPAATASLGVLGSPVIGVIASVLILGERPTATDNIGFALIFAASALTLLARNAPVAATAQPT
jgi:drug/metabolite transporter (DMT)-like permease